MLPRCQFDLIKGDRVWKSMSPLLVWWEPVDQQKRTSRILQDNVWLGKLSVPGTPL